MLYIGSFVHWRSAFRCYVILATIIVAAITAVITLVVAAVLDAVPAAVLTAILFALLLAVRIIKKLRFASQSINYPANENCCRTLQIPSTEYDVILRFSKLQDLTDDLVAC